MRSLHTATKSSPCSPQVEKTDVQQEKLRTAKIFLNKLNLKKLF